MPVLDWPEIPPKVRTGWLRFLLQSISSKHMYVQMFFWHPSEADKFLSPGNMYNPGRSRLIRIRLVQIPNSEKNISRKWKFPVSPVFNFTKLDFSLSEILLYLNQIIQNFPELKSQIVLRLISKLEFRCLFCNSEIVIDFACDTPLRISCNRHLGWDSWEKIAIDFACFTLLWLRQQKQSKQGTSWCVCAPEVGT